MTVNTNGDSSGKRNNGHGNSTTSDDSDGCSGILNSYYSNSVLVDICGFVGISSCG